MSMLVLSRKLGEKVNFYDETKYIGKLIIVDIDRGKVRVGFEMPANIKIFREEIDFDQERQPITTAWGKVEASNEDSR